ncbi:MAG: NAD-dependent epimerase/dehydratase family protein [Pseudorhodobacter sp.]
MSRVLLVGGTGFIGKRVAKVLHAAGISTRVFDLGPALERAEQGPDLECVAGDARDIGAVISAAEGCAGIVHLAGLMTVDCAKDPPRAIAVNVQGSLNVFEAARIHSLPVAYLSTAGVFGPDSAENPHPMTIYGVSKLAVEGIARVYAADHDVPSLGLRPYIVYGPGISSGIAAGPSIALAAALRHEAAVIRFSGRVGFVHVDDVARMLVAGVTGTEPGTAILTMAGDTREMADFVTELSRQSGWNEFQVEGPPLRIPADLTSSPVPAWLGPQPATSIKEGIRLSLDEMRGQ